MKGETARGKIRDEVKAFLEAHYKEQKDDGIDEEWDELRDARKGIAHRTLLAARLGFSSYSRYFRACVLCYGIEPVELERRIFDEVMSKTEEPGAAVKQEDEVRITKDEVRGVEASEEVNGSAGSELGEVEVARSA